MIPGASKFEWVCTISAGGISIELEFPWVCRGCEEDPTLRSRMGIDPSPTWPLCWFYNKMCEIPADLPLPVDAKVAVGGWLKGSTTVGSAISCESFFLHRRRNRQPNIARMRSAKPPTTPPMMGPRLIEL